MVITRTPHRISFFGGGTDFPLWYKEHGGAVLSVTIDKYSYISIRKLPPYFQHKHKLVFFSKHEDFNEIDEIKHPAVREVYRFMNIKNGLIMHHDSDLPSHSGLGSSSAFTVGLLHALYALQGKIVTKKRLALEAIHIEQEMIKEAVGSQDQVASAFGGFNKITFNKQNNIEVTPITVLPLKLSYLRDRLMLFFTGLPRFAQEIERDKINNLSKIKSYLKEMHSMVDVAIDILNGDISGYDDFGKMLHETWTLKKQLSNMVSTNMIDEIYDTAIESGALGGKILGAGGGGFVVFYVPLQYQNRVKKALERLLLVNFRFDTLGTQVIYYTEEM